MDGSFLHCQTITLLYLRESSVLCTLYSEVLPKIKTKKSFECDMDTRMYIYLVARTQRVMHR